MSPWVQAIVGGIAGGVAVGVVLVMGAWIVTRLEERTRPQPKAPRPPRQDDLS